MHIQKLIFPVAFILSLTIPSFATETTPESVPDQTAIVEEEVIDETQLDGDSSGDTGDDESDSSGSDSFDYDNATVVAVDVYSLSPVTPSDTTGLKSVLLSFVGDYDPVIVEYEYESYNGSTSYLREVQPDFVWLCSVAFLAFMCLSVFKLGGAILCRR